MPTKSWRLRAGLWMALAGTPLAALAGEDPAKPAAPAETKVSYYKQVRPIFQAQCQGCHQPAKDAGGYVMTTFDRLVKGGETGSAAVVPGKPGEGLLGDQITPDKDGKALMPKGKPALSAAEREVITKWITEGAVDDTPLNAVARYDMEHPPQYSRPPVIPALAFAPDGQLLAVAGFNEVLLWKADGSELVGRLVGLSERVESLAFSPDGTRLAVTGGQPARMGEAQVWDVAKKKLLLSVPITADTVYGASWSPDGTKLAFGCADNSVRAIDAKTGEQVLFMGSHNDWALDTVWSAEGTNLVSVSRDMSVKLIEFATQRFVDNVTSITPGALKGGIGAIARHPQRDEIVIGGSDGVPKIYRIFRQAVRVIGDDANQIRELAPMTGRVTSVAVSADGKRIAAASSLDGKGQVNVYAYEFDPNVPDNIKAIHAKIPAARSAEDKAALDKYYGEGTRQIASALVPETGLYAIAFRPDGQIVAAAGSDGQVRLIEAATGKIQKSFVPAPIAKPATVADNAAALPTIPEEAQPTETMPQGASLASLDIQPGSIVLTGRFAYAQLVVIGKLASGDTLDVTRMVEAKLSAPVAEVSPTGLVRPRANGQAKVTLSLAGKSVEVPVTVSGLGETARVDFIHDVNPVLSKLGCNQGTCHGSAQGKNGFKLSLRGYDQILDVRALTDDHAGRRVNLASPEDSLMLDKPTGTVPHVGGAVFKPGEVSYEVLRSWIADGAKLDLTTPRVTKIEVYPANAVVPLAGSRQQIRVLATYANGEVRDVSREAFLDSGNIEVASASRTGLVTALRRGEAPILVRYEGAYAAATLTVMGDRTGFAWQDPPALGKIDELVAAKWKLMKIQPSDVCPDSEFLRRVYLDLTGLPPTAEEVKAFLADQKESRLKREAVVDKLIGSPEYVDYWTNKWADLLQVNRKFLAVEGATAFRGWIREQVDKNVPYDQYVRSILTATGSNKDNPAASYYKILREPAAEMENTTQLFLAVRFNCNKCHDHPFERWTQDQYYQTASYFAQVGLKADAASNGRNIGGSAVEGAKPLYEIVEDTGSGEVVHDRTKQVAAPKFPYETKHTAPEKANRRQELAAWLTSPENPYFAKSYVNRLWGYLFGVGIIEPLDDIRAGNPPTNPQLLDHLTQEFIQSGFNTRHVIRLIVTSRTYQLSVATNKWNEDDRTNFSHAIARRLPAEVLYDTVYKVTGAVTKIPGVPPGTRAAALPDSGVELPSGFLATFGRPVRESACECERTTGLQLGPIMALVSGPTISEAIDDPNNGLAKLIAAQADDRAVVNELFLQVLNRPATPAEIDTCLKDFQAIDDDHAKLAAMLGQLESQIALQRPQLERQRAAAIATAQAAQAAHEQELAPKRAEQEKQRADRIAQAEEALKAYDATLPVKLAEWEKKQNVVSRWAPLVPKAATATDGVKLTPGPDGSIVVSGENKQGVLTIVAETDLTDITGIRLEMLTDAGSPNNGPGRAPDGNFVLNEFKLTTAPKAEPAKAQPVSLENPLADFSQLNYDIKNAVDGSPNPGKGWAVSPTTGVVHWATFQPKSPVGQTGGTVLTFTMLHRFQQGFLPGKFRISVTRAAKPVGLDLAEDLRAIIAVAPEVRGAAQKAALQSYFQLVDAERRGKVDALNLARAALPEDAKLAQLKNAVAEAQKPIPPDPRLTQLRGDVELSIKQAVARRLTAAQDVAWALINSPAFLFNH